MRPVTIEEIHHAWKTNAIVQRRLHDTTLPLVEQFRIVRKIQEQLDDEEWWRDLGGES